MHTNQIVAIVLAAGQAKRMGSIKQLLKHKDKTLIQVAIENISTLKIPLIVVLGAYSEKIAESIQGYDDLSTVINPDWQKGISTSINSGLSSVVNRPVKARAVIIALADQPGITSEHYRALIKKGEASGNMVATKYKDILGVPAFFPREYFDDLNALTGDRGAQSLFLTKPHQVEYIEFELAADDIDTEQDWRDYVNRN